MLPQARPLLGHPAFREGSRCRRARPSARHPERRGRGASWKEASHSVAEGKRGAPLPLREAPRRGSLRERGDSLPSPGGRGVGVRASPSGGDRQRRGLDRWRARRSARTPSMPTTAAAIPTRTRKGNSLQSIYVRPRWGDASSWLVQGFFSQYWWEIACGPPMAITEPITAIRRVSSPSRPFSWVSRWTK